MLDIDSGEHINALYKLYDIKGGKKEEKFQSTNISEAIAFHKNYAVRFRRGLYMEILPEKKKYN
jgi:hypothetical protein